MFLFGPPNVEKLREKKNIKGLVKALAYKKDREIRAKAAEILGHMVEPTTLSELREHATESLIAALGDEDWQVRKIATQVLGQLQDARAIEPLVKALRDRESSVRDSVAKFLVQFQDVRAVEPLIKVLEDGDWQVRKIATQVLGQLQDARAVEPLVKALKDQELLVRISAAEVLGRFQDVRAVEPLIKTLADKVGVVRRSAAEALGQFQDARVVEPFIKALEDEDTSVRSVAAKALGILRDTRAIEPLIKALVEAWMSSNRSWRFEEAAEALANLGQPQWRCSLVGNLRQLYNNIAQSGDARFVVPLINVLRSWQYEDLRRCSAADALGKLKDVRAVEPLIEASSNPSIKESIKESAVEALKQIIICVHTIEPLIMTLRKCKNLEIRKIAVDALGTLKDVRAVEPLIEASNDPSIKESAVEVLKQTIICVRTIEPLIMTLRKCKNLEIRKLAADTLGTLKDVRAVKPLIQALGDPDSGIRKSAVEVLGQLKDVTAVEPLIKALGDSDSEVRSSAAVALGQLRDNRAIEPLIQTLVDEDVALRGYAAEALANLGESKWKLLVEGDLRQICINLGKSGDPRTIRPLITILRECNISEVRKLAAEMLGQLQNARAVEPLIQALWDSNSDVRQSSAGALAKLGEPKWEKLISGNLTEDIKNILETRDSRLGEPLYQLRWYGRPSALEALQKALRRGDNSAALILCQLRAWEPLIGALRDGSLMERKWAAEALVMIASQKPELIRDKWDDFKTLIHEDYYGHAESYSGNNSCGYSEGPLIHNRVHTDRGIGPKFPPKFPVKPKNLDF